MAVKIRLARFGCRHRPFYRVVATDSKSRREGKHLEVLGYYNPLPGPDGAKQMELKFDRVNYWLLVGAQPSEAANHILVRAGLLQLPPHVLVAVHKGQHTDSQVVDSLSGCCTTPEITEDGDQLKEEEGSLTCLLAYPPP